MLQTTMIATNATIPATTPIQIPAVAPGLLQVGYVWQMLLEQQFVAQVSDA